MLELYNNIKNRRIELELTQSELAHKLGYADKSMIAKIEKGLIDLPQSKIEAFAIALKTLPQKLMGWISDDTLLLDYFDSTLDEIISFLEKNNYVILQTDSWNDNTVVIKNHDGHIIKTTTEGDLVGQYERMKMDNLPKTIENLLDIKPDKFFPENIRAVARGIMDLSTEDQKTALEMINFLSQKGKEAKKD